MKLITIMSLFLTTSGWSTVTVEGVDCPSQFEGKVKKIISEVGPSHPLSTQRVVFENHHTLKGEVGSRVQLDILKNGPFQIEQGEDYRVQMREGKLCWIERL